MARPFFIPLFSKSSRVPELARELAILFNLLEELWAVPFFAFESNELELFFLAMKFRQCGMQPIGAQNLEVSFFVERALGEINPLIRKLHEAKLAEALQKHNRRPSKEGRRRARENRQRGHRQRVDAYLSGVIRVVVSVAFPAAEVSWVSSALNVVGVLDSDWVPAEANPRFR